jgi:hypothetical protein
MKSKKYYIVDVDNEANMTDMSMLYEVYYYKKLPFPTNKNTPILYSSTWSSWQYGYRINKSDIFNRSMELDSKKKAEFLINELKKLQENFGKNIVAMSREDIELRLVIDEL